MSRNLCQTHCACCGGEVIVVGEIHEATAGEVGRFTAQFLGMKVANARCGDCGTPYLAWFEYLPFEGWRGQPMRFDWDGKPEVIDLSYRHSFNDEPHHDGRDAPMVNAEQVREARRMRALAWEVEANGSPQPQTVQQDSTDTQRGEP